MSLFGGSRATRGASSFIDRDWIGGASPRVCVKSRRAIHVRRVHARAPRDDCVRACVCRSRAIYVTAWLGAQIQRAQLAHRTQRRMRRRRRRIVLILRLHRPATQSYDELDFCLGRESRPSQPSRDAARKIELLHIPASTICQGYEIEARTCSESLRYRVKSNIVSRYEKISIQIRRESLNLSAENVEN